MNAAWKGVALVLASSSVSLSLQRTVASPGLTWSSQSNGTESLLNTVAAADANTAWAAGFDGTIVGTWNGGETWSLQTSGTAENLFWVDFSDANTGWAVGDSGTIRHTIDGGNTWKAQVSGTNKGLGPVAFANAKIGWVMSGASVLHTFSGGEKVEVPVLRARLERRIVMARVSPRWCMSLGG